MKKIIFTFISTLFLALNGSIFSENLKPQTEMTSYSVTYVQDFEDADRGAIFKLNDGSQWYRTWWEGPVYFLNKGQEIALIPMTEEEAQLHQDPLFNAKPYWLILHPNDDTASEFFIAFCLKRAP